MRGMRARAFAFAAAAAILVTACSTTGTPSGGGTTAGDQGKPFVFASTQFSPVTEQENMRKKILAAYQGASVDFVTDNEPTILNRISAEAKAGGEQQIGLAGLENGQFAALVAAGAFDDVTKIADKHKDQKIPQDMLTLGKFGGNAQVYIPWMQATYFMVASKQALQYLPSGADVNALTYQQTIAWAKNIFDKTGQKKFGFPLGTDGLIHRLIQGYFYPSYTGGLVTTYKSADAATMWNDMKELWKYSNPQSTTYARLQEPLQSGDIWLGIDHVAVGGLAGTHDAAHQRFHSRPVGESLGQRFPHSGREMADAEDGSSQRRPSQTGDLLIGVGRECALNRGRSHHHRRLSSAALLPGGL